MVNPIKPEKKSKFINVAVTPSMDEKISQLAEKHDATKSDVARHIFEWYFEALSENPEADLPKNATDFEIFGVTL